MIVAIAKSHNIGLLSTEFFGMMAMINVYLFLFNLLPVPPLDSNSKFRPPTDQSESWRDGWTSPQFMILLAN